MERRLMIFEKYHERIETNERPLSRKNGGNC